MNKFNVAFIKSHLKKAIWHLECANKLTDDDAVVNENIVDELKLLLLELEVKNAEK